MKNEEFDRICKQVPTAGYFEINDPVSGYFGLALVWESGLQEGWYAAAEGYGYRYTGGGGGPAEALVNLIEILRVQVERGKERRLS